MPKFQFDNQYPITSCFECPFAMRKSEDGSDVMCWLNCNIYKWPQARPDDCPLRESHQIDKERLLELSAAISCGLCPANEYCKDMKCADALYKWLTEES